jgi:hypothetical protein
MLLLLRDMLHVPDTPTALNPYDACCMPACGLSMGGLPPAHLIRVYQSQAFSDTLVRELASATIHRKQLRYRKLQFMAVGHGTCCGLR